MADSLTVRVGRLRDGRDLVLALGAAWHLGLQGATRSGKSVTAYSLLGGLARYYPRVVVAGLDPSGLLLHPWRDSAHREWRATGTCDLEAAADAMDALVAEMDRRIELLLNLVTDKLDRFTPDLPLIVAVFEEYPGMLSALNAEDQGRKPADRLTPRVQRAVRRLIQEGAKVGVRVLLVAQRFEAAIIGGAERSNVGTRLSHRVDNSDSVGLLFPDPDPDFVALVKRLPPGRGFVQLPGQEPVEFQADLSDYRLYNFAVLRGTAALEDARK